MKKILYVLLDMWADWEAAYIMSAVASLGDGEFENVIVSTKKDGIKSIGNLTCMPDCDLETAPQDYEALVLIGGYSWRSDGAEKVVPLVENCVNNNKVLGAICDASRFLGSHGFLNKVKHTANDLKELIQYPEYKNADGFLPRQVVSDGNIITANGTGALEFAAEMLCAIKITAEKNIKDWYDFHKLGYYTVLLPKM